MNVLNWGIMSTGVIARRFAKALKDSKSGRLRAVASRDLARAEAFAGEFGPATAHGNYPSLLADPSVDAVYIAVPHPWHAEWSIRAARAGKHILCEKPAAMNHAEAELMIGAARENGVFFMEAFMYRCHPQTARLVEILRAGEIGEVRQIEATFSFHTKYDRLSRLFNNRLGGGGILDIGCYCVSMTRLIAATALGRDTVEPIQVKGVGWLDPAEGTDLTASAVLEFPGNITAHVSCGVQLNQTNHVRVYGSKGSLTLNEPWLAGCHGACISLSKSGQELPEIISTESELDLYSHEIDMVARYKDRGQAPFPVMGWDDTLGNMKVLDAWRKEIGVVFESDSPTWNVLAAAADCESKNGSPPLPPTTR